MATVGLKGIWGLEQLDETGISSWKLVLLLNLAGYAVGVALFFLVGNVNADSPLASYFTSTVTATTVVIVCALIGFLIPLDVAIARAIEADLLLLLPVDDLRESTKLLKPSAKIFLPLGLMSVLFTTLTSPIMSAERLEISLAQSIFNYFDAGGGLSLTLIVLWPLLGLTLGIGFMIGICQIRCLMEVAKTIRVDLLQLNLYSAIANPAIRIILIIVLFLSTFPIVMLYVNDPVYSSQVTGLAFIMMIIMTPLLVMWCYPVLLLRNRIRDKKAEELQIILMALQGSDEALDELSSIQSTDKSHSTSELLIHQMFIESRWEWPIAAHVQKLILFGLLPPLTWVLAAGIENFMF